MRPERVDHAWGLEGPHAAKPFPFATPRRSVVAGVPSHALAATGTTGHDWLRPINARPVCVEQAHSPLCFCGHVVHDLPSIEGAGCHHCFLAAHAYKRQRKKNKAGCLIDFVNVILFVK